MDLCTALDLTLDGQMEAKFLALKNLHAKKTKQLMLSIEAKEKEIAKLKVLGKDSRRTQMIQALRDKIRSMELASDVIKAELGKSEHPSRGQMTPEEVNEFVIEKTVGGPKRFRPLTREELENKIIGLEKLVLSKGRSSSGGVDTKSVAGSVGSRPTSAANSVASKKPAARSESKISESDTPTTAANKKDTARIVQLMEEVEALRLALDVAEGAVELQKEEVSRLRERNAELVSSEEESDFAKMQYRELRAAYDSLSGDLTSSTRKLTEYTEENMILRSDKDVVAEQQAVEIDALHEQCDRLLTQNSLLLERMGEMEIEIDAASNEKRRVGQSSHSAEAEAAAKANALSAAEKRLSKTKEQLRVAEARISELTTEGQQIPSLTGTIREKNGVIRDLTRKLEDRGISVSPSRRAGDVAKTSTSSPVKSDQIADNDKGESFLRRQIADLMEDNKKLKQALSAAAITASAAKSSASSPAKASAALTDDIYMETVRSQTTLLANLIEYTTSSGLASTRAPVLQGCEKLMKLLDALGGHSTLLSSSSAGRLHSYLDTSESKS